MEQKLENLASIFCGSSASGMSKIIKTKKQCIEEGLTDYIPLLMTSDFTRYEYTITKYAPKSLFSDVILDIFENNENIFIGRMTKEIRAVIVEKGISCGKVNCLTNLKMNKYVLWSILSSNLISFYYSI